MTTKIRDCVKNLFLKKEKKKCHETRGNYLSTAKISYNGNAPVLLSAVENLSMATSIKGSGKWGCDDFTLLSQKLKSNLYPLSANTSLQKIDLGEICLREDSPAISFKKLFCYCVNVTTIILPNASQYTNSISFHATFKGCSRLKQIVNFETYQKISNLSSTFCYCCILEEIKIATLPLPTGDKETFQKANNIKVIVPHGTHIPDTWIQIKPQNIYFHS